VQDAASIVARASAFRRRWYVFKRLLEVVFNSKPHYIVLSQSASGYTDPTNGFQFTGLTDPVHNVTYGFVFPPLVSSGAQSTEFIGEVVAPLSAAWIGVALGGAMNGDLLLVAWPNGNQIVSSTRWAR
jgi:cellobiose dehydrogenase (acceptor)